MEVMDSQINTRHYNIEGLRLDYYSLQSLIKSTKDKKEKKILASWLEKIRDTLNELGEEV